MTEGEKKTGEKDSERRVYTTEFKAGAVAPAEKHGKPVSHVAADLGINENVLYRRIQRARESAGIGLPAFPGHERPRDEEPARPRKENKALREAV
ncbi:MAG: transposase [Treponema sp.]|nr:transposase [Treponema sp.]